jgi:hypothetical protein
MAVTPVELLTFTAAQISVQSRARGIIDAELRLNYDNQWPVKIRRGIIDFMFKENEAVLETLLNEYRAAGWSIISYSSEDQGDWFSFYPS